MLSRSESFLWFCKALQKKRDVFEGLFQTPQNNKTFSEDDAQFSVVAPHQIPEIIYIKTSSCLFLKYIY